MAWFSLAKIALQAGSKIYSNRQKTKMAMSDAQLMHAEKMARGEETYQGKLLEARQNDYKDEFVLVIISAPIVVLNVGSNVGRSDCYGEGKTILSNTFMSFQNGSPIYGCL